MTPTKDFPTFTTASFALLDGLFADNSKRWFDEHRPQVKSYLIDPFAAMLEAVTVRIAGTDIPLSGGVQTMFRMNRDIRFSTDKSPYRHSVAGLLTTTGNKSDMKSAIYVEMTRTGGWAGGGFYDLATADLNVIRDRIVADPEAWGQVKRDIADRGGQLAEGDQLKGMPRGYADRADAPYADDLRRKNLVVRIDLPRPVWLDGTVVDQVAKAACACAPLIRFG